MAAPNIKNPTTITGKTAKAGIDTTASIGIVTNGASSGKVLKINTILAANVDGTSPVDVSVFINDGDQDFHIVHTLLVPPDSTQVICQKDTYFYLEEGHELKVTASAINDVDIIVGFEEIS